MKLAFYYHIAISDRQGAIAMPGYLGVFIDSLAENVDFLYLVMHEANDHEKEEADEILYENTAFPGGWISMPPPLEDDLVEYRDNHSSTVHHMSEDVSAFLMWAAEPKMMARKQAGFVGVLFLTILSVLLYLTNKRIWAPIKGKKTS